MPIIRNSGLKLINEVTMKNLIISILIGGTIFQSCTPRVKSSLSPSNYGSLGERTEVFVLEVNDEVPENSQYVGELRVGNSGFSTDCGYKKVLEEARRVSRNSGANLICLTEFKEPRLSNQCYRIRAKMYRNFNSESLEAISAKRDLLRKSRLPKEADYAIVHFYRPQKYFGSIIRYKLRHNDKTVISKVKNGDIIEFKTKEFGKHIFWGKTETKTVVEIEIEKGQEYFVRCGVKGGITVGRPDMYLIENHVGIKEMKKIKTDK